MPDPKEMEKQMILISETMQQVEELVRSKVKTHDDFMAVCSALMAVTRNMYLESLSVEETAQIFTAVADTMFATEEMLYKFKHLPKPTIH
jgi:flagellar biosynthesis component FlhA